MKNLFFLGLIFLLLFSLLVGVTSFPDLQNSLSIYSDRAESLSFFFQDILSDLLSLIFPSSSESHTLTESELSFYKNTLGSFDPNMYYRKYDLEYYDDHYDVRTVAKETDYLFGTQISDEVVVFSSCPYILEGSHVKNFLVAGKSFEWTENGDTLEKSWVSWNYQSYENSHLYGIAGKDYNWNASSFTGNKNAFVASVQFDRYVLRLEKGEIFFAPLSLGNFEIGDFLSIGFENGAIVSVNGLVGPGFSGVKSAVLLSVDNLVYNFGLENEQIVAVPQPILISSGIDVQIGDKVFLIFSNGSVFRVSDSDPSSAGSGSGGSGSDGSGSDGSGSGGFVSGFTGSKNGLVISVKSGYYECIVSGNERLLVPVSKLFAKTVNIGDILILYFVDGSLASVSLIK